MYRTKLFHSQPAPFIPKGTLPAGGFPFRDRARVGKILMILIFCPVHNKLNLVTRTDNSNQP